MGKYSIERADRARGACEGALTWLVKFYPDIQIERHAGQVDIASPSRSADEISLLWKATLLTEVRRDLSAGKRRQDLEELVR